MTEKEKTKQEDVLTKELETYKAAGANLLVPSTHIAGLSEFHHPVIETVLLNPDPDAGDVYPHDNSDPGPRKKFRPTKQALMKLSVCAGVIWSTTESRRIDNGADRNYIAYKAVGGIRKADGQPVFFSAEYDLDFEILEEELRESYEQKTKGDWAKKKTDQQKAEYVEYCVKRDLLQKRKNKLKLCEAGAMNRVLRMLLGIKQAYTTAELSKPFVTARIVFRPDFNDKEVRAKLLDASIKAMTGIYGDSVAPQPIPKTEPIDVTPIETIEDGGNGNDPETTPYEMSAEKQPFVEAAPTEDLGILDFQNSDVAGQVKTITDMAKQAKYDMAGWLAKVKKNSVAELTPEKRLEIFKHLRPKMDVEPDDVPL